MRILDAGCKEGWTGDHLLQVYPGQIVVQSVELLDKFVTYAKTLGREHVQQGDICALPPGWTGLFDLVVCRHVLGLVESVEKAFCELHRVSKGFVYIITHIPGNEKKHYQCMETVEDLETLLSLVDAQVLYFGPNPKQHRYQDRHRVEYIILTKVRNPLSYYDP
ncbi:MAG: class I SAM-dependent methyltransferase [Candidatus Thorarchaeota archaeon]